MIIIKEVDVVTFERYCSGWWGTYPADVGLSYLVVLVMAATLLVSENLIGSRRVFTISRIT